MAQIYLRDERVTSAENIVAEINMLVRQTDNLERKLSELADQISSNFNTAVPAWFNELHILCHGLPEGLQLGAAPAVNHNNVGVFRLLRHKVGHIVIHGCSAAFVYPRGTNGTLMCRRMAFVVGANVTASDATQYYLPSDSMQNTSNRARFANWRGNVATWNPQGRLIDVSTEESRQRQAETGSL